MSAFLAAQRFSSTVLAALAAGVLVVSPLAAAPAAPARIEEGSKVLGQGEVAEFAIVSSAETSADLRVSCEVSSGGAASVTFDGEHYIPLSEPTVGEVLTFSAGETRNFDIIGTVEKNKGDAYIAFSFSGVPAAMCFPGMDCGGASAGAKNVKVTCRNAK